MNTTYRHFAESNIDITVLYLPSPGSTPKIFILTELSMST